MAKFTIKIENPALGGYCPAYFKGGYPTYGNNNQLVSMTNIDLTDPAFLTQGPGITALTNGTQAGNVSTLIKGMLSEIESSDSIYGVGGDTLYQISSSAVSAGHTINHPSKSSEDGEDVAKYAGDLYYSYNHNTGGDIGTFDLSSTYDDDWWTAVAGGSELTDNPHQLAVGGTDGLLWIADGQYVKQWDGTTATDDAFNTDDSDSIIQSLVWNQDRVHIAANKPNVTGTNKNIASIYIWDGYSANWEARIEVRGRVGALYVKDGVTFVWYQKNLSDDVITLGYVTGTQVKDLADYTGDLPSYYQVTEYKDFLTWLSADDIFCYGSGGANLPARLFQLAATTHTTAGGITNAFGTPIVASNQSTNYEVGEFSGYTTTSSFKTISFNVAEWARKSMIHELHVNFEQLATGAECDLTLRDNQGTAKWTGTISYTGDGAVTRKKFNPKCTLENLRLEGDFSDGSATNPVKIRSIYMVGSAIV